MYGIFIYLWLKYMVHVGKNSSPMDPMGIDIPLYFQLYRTFSPKTGLGWMMPLAGCPADCMMT